MITLMVDVISERDSAHKVVLQGGSSVGTPVCAVMSAPVGTALYSDARLTCVHEAVSCV